MELKRIRICSIFAWVFIYAFSINPVFASNLGSDKKVIQNMVQALHERHWDKAIRLSKNLNEPAIKTFIIWMKLREGVGSFENYISFLKKNSHWPGLQILKQKGESKIQKNTDPVVIVSYFKNAAPNTGFGSMRLIEAYEKLSMNDKALGEVHRAWVSLSIAREEVNFFTKKYKKLTIPIVQERVDFLLWNGLTTQATGLLIYLDKDTRALAKARISLRRQSYGVDSLIQKIPYSLSADPGLAYERFIWRAKKGRVESAMEILQAQSKSKEKLKLPDKWSRKRRDYARQAMRDNKQHLAYFLASNHFISGGSDYADLEWLAGYISLRKLNKPLQAIIHFNNFLNEVETPISLGRAGYWLGRAYEVENNSRLSNYYYTLGANYQSSFYGQLSAEKIGVKLRKDLISPIPYISGLKTDFGNVDIFRLAVLLYDAGEHELSRRFFSHLAKDLDDTEHLQLTNFLKGINSDYLALVLSKQAARKGRIYSDTYFPMHDLISLSLKVEPAILLAVARRESEFNPKAISRAGARGLMQLMPSTAKKVAYGLSYKYSLKRLNSDWEYNVELGAEYLHFLFKKYDGSFLLSLGAYNAGPARMDGWIKKYGDPRNNDTDYVDWIEHIPFNETRNYIMRVMEAMLIYRAKLNDKKNGQVKIRLSKLD